MATVAVYELHEGSLRMGAVMVVPAASVIHLTMLGKPPAGLTHITPGDKA